MDGYIAMDIFLDKINVKPKENNSYIYSFSCVYAIIKKR